MTVRTSPRLGKDSCIYRNTGTYAAPVLALLKNAKGVKLPNSKATDDVTSRMTGGFEASVNTITKLGVSWKMFDDDGADITAVRTAFNTDAVVELFVLNGAADDAASKGWRMTGQFSKFEEDQDETKANVFDVEFKPGWPDPANAGTPSCAPITGTFDVD